MRIRDLPLILSLAQEYEKSFSKGTFSLHVAFSRELENKKVYVQDLLHDHAAALRNLILRENAYVYVCGDASRMAKDVFGAFAHILADECEKDFKVTGDWYLRTMKAAGRWSEDVW